ncbi:MAG: sugar ABC transporter permease [Anaerolineaceae bacterium]|nr:sugar ABC transporter permease [Anaerolineaceae bacterium]
MIASIYYSFHNYNIASIEYVGLANYKELFSDEIFLKSLIVTGTYVCVSVPLSIIAALTVAVLLNQEVPFLSFWRTLYYLPSIISGVASALLWRWIFNGKFGIINNILTKIGIAGPDWFNSETWALPAYWIIALWGIGSSMVIYLAALQGVPTSLYEAAEVDGANAITRFFKITIPMISPVLLYTLITNTISGIQVFTMMYVISGGQGGPNYATMVYVLYLYKNAFQWNRFGYASAIAWILFIVISISTILLIKGFSKRVYYEDPNAG